MESIGCVKRLSLNRIATDGHAGGFDTRTQKAAMDQHETRTARARRRSRACGAQATAGGTPAGTRWAAVLAIVGAGVVAALQVGKVIIAAPLLRRDMGLDLAAVGSLTAVFSVLGMVGGIAAGGVIARFGARRMLLLAATALGTAAGAAARATRCWHRACSKGWVS